MRLAVAIRYRYLTFLMVLPCVTCLSCTQILSRLPDGPDDVADSDVDDTVDAEVDTDGDSDIDSDIDGDIDSDIDSDSDSDSDSDIDGDSDVDGDCDWSRGVMLEFDNALQPEDLIDFPVLVVLDSSRIDNSLTMDFGEDIRFTDADLVTELPYQIEVWDNSGTSFVWVKVPQIDASSTADHIWLSYGNASASVRQDRAGVWNARYTGVWHLHDDFQDSTGYDHHGTNHDSTDAPGMFGDGQRFDGSNDSVCFGSTPGSDVDLTFSLWFMTDRDDALQRPIRKMSSTGLDGWTILMRPFDAADGFPRGLIFRIGSSDSYGGWGNEVSASDVYTANDWVFLAGTYDSATRTGTLFVNGVQVDSRINDDDRGVANSEDDLCIGEAGGEDFQGLIDEVRVSDVARSSAYVAAQYLSMTDAFITYVDSAGPRPCPSE